MSTVFLKFSHYYFKYILINSNYIYFELFHQYCAAKGGSSFDIISRNISTHTTRFVSMEINRQTI